MGKTRPNLVSASRELRRKPLPLPPSPPIRNRVWCRLETKNQKRMINSIKSNELPFSELSLCARHNPELFHMYNPQGGAWFPLHGERQRLRVKWSHSISPGFPVLRGGSKLEPLWVCVSKICAPSPCHQAEGARLLSPSVLGACSGAQPPVSAERGSFSVGRKACSVPGLCRPCENMLSVHSAPASSQPHPGALVGPSWGVMGELRIREVPVSAKVTPQGGGRTGMGVSKANVALW